MSEEQKLRAQIAAQLMASFEVRIPSTEKEKREVVERYAEYAKLLVSAVSRQGAKEWSEANARMVKAAEAEFPHGK